MYAEDELFPYYVYFDKDESVRDMVFFRWCKEQFGRSVGDNITWYCDTEYNRYCFKNENDRNYFLLRWA